MKCQECNKTIPKERLEVLPHTTMCVRCAAENPEPPRHDPNEVCDRASDVGRNGFARNS